MRALSSLLVKLPYKLFYKNARVKVCGNIYTETPNRTKMQRYSRTLFKTPIVHRIAVLCADTGRPNSNHNNRKAGAMLHELKGTNICYVTVDFLTHNGCLACLKAGKHSTAKVTGQPRLLRPYLSCSKHPLFSALSSD